MNPSRRRGSVGPRRIQLRTAYRNGYRDALDRKIPRARHGELFRDRDYLMARLLAKAYRRGWSAAALGLPPSSTSADELATEWPTAAHYLQGVR